MRTLLFACLCLQIHPCWGQNSLDCDMTSTIRNIMETGKYNGKLRPLPNGNWSEPTEITVDLLLHSIHKIDDINMELVTQFTLRSLFFLYFIILAYRKSYAHILLPPHREEWTDRRLEYNSTCLDGITLKGTDYEYIWNPDVFIINEKKSVVHDVMHRNQRMVIYPTGRIRLSTRITVVLACPMEFSKYPFDDQTCYLTFASYSYKIDELIFLWRTDHPPVNVVEFVMEKFNLTSYTIQSNISVGYNKDRFQSMHVLLKFQRKFRYYLTQIYVPTFMLVVISWITFWLGSDSLDARIALGITTLLTMSTSISSFSAVQPQVAYVKAIDIYTGISMFFMVAAILETSTVMFVGRRRNDRVIDDSKKPIQFLQKSTAERIDCLACILFPLGYTIFNLLYFAQYFT